MKKVLIALATISYLATGCGKNAKPTFDLVVGDKTIALPVHEDATRIQDDIVSNVKPLWDNLRSGESVTFHSTRTTPLHLEDDIESKAKDKFGKNTKLTSTFTFTTAPLRFFKNRGGANGMERVDQLRGNSGCIYGESVDWQSIEHYLRSEVFSIQDIPWMIQNDLGEQENATDKK